tara:strand:- start:7 stop:267 length:261 start_codon:yes stop_codon:yes gene_type:complete
MAEKKTQKRAAPKKKATPKKAAPMLKLCVCADGKESEICFSSSADRDAALARLERAAAAQSKGLQHAMDTAEGQFRYTNVSSVTAL